MEQYIKNRIYTLITIIVIVAAVMWADTHYNNDLDTCLHSYSIDEMFYENTTCHRRNLGSADILYDCVKVNKDYVRTYCYNLYGEDYWSWE
jgi:hypothetical protein